MRAFSTLMILPRSGRIAWNSAVAGVDGAPAGGVALDEEELGSVRIAVGAVGQLARQAAADERGLPADQVARLARRLAGPAGGDQLVDDRPRLGRVLLEVLAELGVADGLDQAADRRVAELGLGLALELRLAQLDGHDRRQALAAVVAGQGLLLLLEEALRPRVVVQGAGQRGLEAGEVGAALVGVDVVRERVRGLDVGAVPLHRDLELALVGLALEVDDVLVDRVLAVVDVEDEVGDAALEPEVGLLAAGALVGELDAQAPGQERHLAQPLSERLEHIVGRLEDVAVGQEGDGRAGVGGLLAHRERAERIAALVALAPRVAVTADLEVERLRERVHDRDADTVQAARHLVAPTAELPAGVELGQDDLGRRQPEALHHRDRDPAAVVGDGHPGVGSDGDGDVVAVTLERLVDGVVDDLVDEMVEPAKAGGADVHAGPLAYRLEALQN